MIERPKKPGYKYIVRVYDPAVGKKVYAGSFGTLKEAKAAERLTRVPQFIGDLRVAIRRNSFVYGVF